MGLIFSWTIYVCAQAEQRCASKSRGHTERSAKVRSKHTFTLLLRAKSLTAVSFCSASINPINWIREKLTPNIREEPSKKELESARKEQVAKGEGSVFEQLVVKKEEAEAGEKEGPKIQWVDDSQLKPRNPDLKVRSHS